MNTIHLSGADAAQIILAVIADRLERQPSFKLGQLQQCWVDVGLRADDLIQGLSILIRTRNLRIDGEDPEATVHVCDPGSHKIPAQGGGFDQLEPRLKDIVEFAKNRKHDEDGTRPIGERRKGFN